MASSLSTWLATLSRRELAGVLTRRADALRGPEPRNVSELAERLQHPGSVFEALTALNVPCLQAVEALLSLGGDPTPARLVQLLDSEGDPEHAACVDIVLATLRQSALVWPSGDGLRLAAGLRNAFPDPLGLGTPARALLAEQTVAQLQTIQKRLGLPRAGNKRAVVDSIVERLTDAQFVRERIAELPTAARAHLERFAAREDFDIRAYQAPFEAERQLVERGLLIEAMWGRQTHLPAEVARALRGDEFRAPFAPHAPRIEWDALGVEAVEGEAGVRAADFAERAATVLDLVAAEPLVLLKSGGVGTRELARLAKAAGTSDSITRLIVELAGAAGLLDAVGDSAMATPAFDEWREQEPAQRLAPLLSAWGALPATPTASRDEDGKALPALSQQPPCEACRGGRHALLSTAASAPDGQAARDADAVVFAAWWSRPAIHLVRGSDDGPVLAWSEAESLGVIARGAVTSVGRALLADVSLEASLDRLLPASTQTASFGSDLTVVVSGAPSARVRALLDGCADREGRGAATVWRFTPASIRRALDSGVASDDLARDLADIAVADLPQPLRYLIGDVARRHGHLRVSAASCCIVASDEALLAEVVAHRKLRSLRLRLLAPTVAIGGSSVRETVAALRAAGYLPLAEGTDGALRLERPANARAVSGSRARAAASRPVPRLDPEKVAARLLSVRGSLPVSSAPSGTEALVGEFADALSAAEIRQLAHAIDRDLPIRIEYQAATGGYTSRIVSELMLDPPFLVGWCHLRDAERMFALSRIQSATAV